MTNTNELAVAAVTDMGPTPPGTETAKGELTPDNSDVPPIYMALVAEDDPTAVMNVVALVPAGVDTDVPVVFKRSDGKWVQDDDTLADLKSATPPPVVKLTEEDYKSVMEQMEPTADAVTASGLYAVDHTLMVLWGPNPAVMTARLAEFENADSLTAGARPPSARNIGKNRGNAERLRRYWTVGKGAAKIRWNTGGDWKRCVRYLSKYLGPRAKGYCALRHKEVTGLWTGDQAHRKMYGWGNKKALSAGELLLNTEQILELTTLTARADNARERFALTAGASAQDGAAFVIPLVVPEEVETGDGRTFKKGAIDVRDLPLPLLWQIKTADGHEGSVVVGRIDRMARTTQGIGNAYGVFDTGAYGREAERLVRNGFLRGVSADLDKFEAEEDEKKKSSASAKADGKDKLGGSKMTISKARVMAVTIVPKPAFQECKIVLTENTNNQEDQMIPSGVYVENVDSADAEALVACGFVAGAIPVVPPTEWFGNPNLKQATPLTVTDEGRVYGHIAAWNVDHIGMAFGTRPPRSKSKYGYFHTGVVRTDSGKDMPVGQLTLAGGHAPLHASASDAVKHYDDTASAVADVHAGEDSYGIWVSGALRPGTTPEQVRALRASAPSGDWRPIRGSLELVAVCQVNVPGFPIARAMVAGGQIMALVAAGAQTLARMKSSPSDELQARITKLEQLAVVAAQPQIEELRARVASAKTELATSEMTAKAAELSARVYGTVYGTEYEYEDELAYVSRERRQSLAKKGRAMPDGSFPIADENDLKNAISSYGRAKDSRKAAVRRFIEKRARQLGRADMIPDAWKSTDNK